MGRSVDEESSIYFPPGSVNEDKQVDKRVETLLEDLVKILNAELDQYRDLLRMLSKQRKYLAIRDIASFEETNKQLGTVILKVKTLEEARKSIVLRLAKYFNVHQEAFTLAKLAALVDKPYNEQYAGLRGEILSIIKDLESLKESNAYLIQHALHYVSGVLKIFASSILGDYKYSDSGQLESRQESGKRISGWG